MSSFYFLFLQVVGLFLKPTVLFCTQSKLDPLTIYHGFVCVSFPAYICFLHVLLLLSSNYIYARMCGTILLLHSVVSTVRGTLANGILCSLVPVPERFFGRKKKG